MRSQKLIRTLPSYLVLIMFSAIVLLPILGLAFSAFKTDAEIIKGPLSLPSTWTLDNFLSAWNVGKFDLYFRSSVIVTSSVVFVSVILSVLMGYAFGLMEFPGRKYIYTLVLIGFMVPFEAMILPLYQYLHALKLTDTYWALILPQIGLSISFGTLWMTSFYKNSERELQDAAAIDGCNRFQTLWYIFIPIAIPAILTLVVLIFMWTWNEFLLALVMVQKENLRTLPVGLAFFQGRYTSNIPLMAAGSLIVAGPIIIVYLLFQRYFIRGLTSGAVKG